MIFNLFEIFLQFLFTNAFWIKTFDKLFVLIFIFDIVPCEPVVENLGGSCHCIRCRKNGFVEPNVYPFSILFEVPVLMAIGVLTQNTSSDTNLEWFLIHFLNLRLLTLDLILNIAKLVLRLVFLLFQLWDALANPFCVCPWSISE